ncbi:MAG: DUF1361 domain-containing protein [Bacteroidales bacterium]
MLKKLIALNRLEITMLLVVMSAFSVCLSVTRCIVSNTLVYLFLNWNLFLAFIPWLISSVMIIKGIHKKFSLALLIFSWLLFFPNSPYILTDLFHLRYRGSAPVWFDLILILTYAWTGLLYGFLSLRDIEKLLSAYINKKTIAIISIIFLFMGSFGIYLGRFLRWNSWDIISNPFGLMNDISDRLINPTDHPRTWGMTILMGLLLNMMYFSFRFFNKNKEYDKITNSNTIQ